MKKIRIIWGTEAVRKTEKPIKGYTDKTYTFKTDDELNAFLEGVSEGNGWLEYQTLEKGEKWKMAQQR
tara:strand:- start:1 stop:204 length:204 start_codon:yes stop_codon:yes gene_type:complete